MEIFKSMVFIGEQARHQLIDTIWYESNWWLVSEWLEHEATGHRIPNRIIQLDGRTVRFQEVNEPDHRFLVNNSIPISVFDGESLEGYVTAVHADALSQTQGPASIH